MVGFAAPALGLSAPEPLPTQSPPPLTAPAVKQPAIGPVCPASVDKAKELMITDLAVVEDPTRTTGTGVWTFGHLMQRLAGSFDPAVVSNFTLGWLNTWMSDQPTDQVTLQPFPKVLKSRPNIKAAIIDPWKSASGCSTTGPCTLDMTKAPFRLLAIVNRVDLRQIGTTCSVFGCQFGNTANNAGEGRFVFGALINGNPLSFTVIFEFKLAGFDGFDAQQWARRWHELGTAPQISDPPPLPGTTDQSCWVDPCFSADALWKEKMMWSMGYCVDPSLAALFSANFPQPQSQVCMPQPAISQPACNAATRCPAWSSIPITPPLPMTYNQTLQAITESFAWDSQLGQLRTNEIALDGPWQLREFHLGVDPSTKRNVLQITTVKQTPPSSFNNTQLVADFINQNEADILAEKHTVPITFEGQQFRGGSSDQNTTHWFAKNASGQSLIRNNDARFLFSKNTCNGCHLTETNAPFLHVAPRAAGAKSTLSAFLTGIPCSPTIDPFTCLGGDLVVRDPEDGTPRHFNDLERRRKDMEQLICEPNPSAIQTVNTSVH
jgi:hypothetical protein